MTNQAAPRGHHPGPRRGEVLDTEPKPGTLISFQCQDKTQWETKILTSVLVREGSLGPRRTEEKNTTTSLYSYYYSTAKARKKCND
jgi:hypothetical protein